ncbi:MAG: hypothetical protein AAGG47_22370 [Pseudomonadota bacterium]
MAVYRFERELGGQPLSAADRGLRFETWCRALADVPGQIAKAAVDEALVSLKWFPKPVEVLEIVARLRGDVGAELQRKEFEPKHADRIAELEHELRRTSDPARCRAIADEIDELICSRWGPSSRQSDPIDDPARLRQVALERAQPGHDDRIDRIVEKFCAGREVASRRTSQPQPPAGGPTREALDHARSASARNSRG